MTFRDLKPLQLDDIRDLVAANADRAFGVHKHKPLFMGINSKRFHAALFRPVQLINVNFEQFQIALATHERQGDGLFIQDVFQARQG